MYKHAIQWQLAKFNPTEAVQPPKQIKTEMNFLTESQLNDVLETTKNTDYYIPILIASTTGMRLGEVCALQKDDVDLNAQMIYVKHNLQPYNSTWNLTSTKTHRSTRPIYILDEVIPILKDYQKQQKMNQLKYNPIYEQSNFFCVQKNGSFINPRTLSKYFRKITTKIGYDVRFHDLRHTHASILLKKNIHPKIVSERLGHSQIEITLNTYSHLIPDLQKDALKNISFIKGKKTNLK